MVMAQALAKRLARRGDGPIHMVAPPFALPIVALMPEVARGWALEVGHSTLGLGARWRLARALAAERFERAIVLPRSFKSALVPAFAGVPRRRGVLGEGRIGLINEIAPAPGPGERTVDAFLALAGDPAPLRPDERPRLVVEPGRIAEAAGRFGLGGRFAVLCPGAEYGPAKRWPAGHFAALASRLGAAGLAVAIVGAPKDGEAARAIAAATPEVHDLTGRTTLGEAAALIAGAAVVVSNDSGLMHVAAALDRPTVAVFGSSSPAKTPPLSDRAATVATDEVLPCQPCFARTCRFGHTRCLTTIGPERVAALALERAASA
jgi:heptosyltransferase-2